MEDSHCNYPEPEIFDQLYWVGFAGSMLSLAGSVFICLFYLFLNKHKQAGQFRLILYLALADIVLAIQQPIVNNPCDLDAHTVSCTSQAFLGTFGHTSSLIWTLIFSVVLFCDNKADRVPGSLFRRNAELCYLFWGFGFPLILSLILLLTQQYGPLRYWCWIPVPG